MTPMTIQILRRLKQSEVWRFVGCVSTVVGLLCYALSSPFNRLFGEWSWLKIFLYSVFSFIICSMTLFAKKWQHSQSLLSKAHVAVVVLTATSVYSFFYDKAVNGRPDAYSLISCAAFAVMSLSLSRQTHFGYEVDLLYFFLGCLMIQLMKINSLLAIVGACFSYLLISLRSSLDTTPEGGYGGVQDQGQYHVIDMVPQQQANATGSALFMPHLMACTEALRQKNSNLIDTLLEQVKEYFEGDNESHQLVTDPNFVMDALPSKMIRDLRYTTKFIVGAGFEKECCEVYSSCRREFLEKRLSRLLGLEEHELKNFERLELVWRWFKAFNVALRILFPSERELCNLIFFGFSAATDLCFIEICREPTIHLLRFVDVVASGSPSMWRLLKLLNMFSTLSNLIAKFESSFSESLVINEAIRIRNRLAEAISNLLVKWTDLTFHIPKTKVTVPANGGIHPMAISVMDDLLSACRSRYTLERILQQYPPKGADRAETSDSFSVQVFPIMELLEGKLKAKSKICKDPALRYFFMMNNMSYIEEQLAKILDIKTILGNDWIQKNAAKVRQNLQLYQRSSWNEMLDFLNLDNNEPMEPNVAVESMKEKLSLFNVHFKEITTVQSTWVVPNKQLRKEIRMSLQNILLPAYGKFIGRLQDALGKQAYDYIEYGMFDIEAQLSYLFLGRSK